MRRWIFCLGILGCQLSTFSSGGEYSSGRPIGNPGYGNAGDTDAGPAGDGEAPIAACTDVNPGGAGVACVLTISGRIVQAGGTTPPPAVDQMTSQLCTQSVCMQGIVAADGTFSVAVNRYVNLAEGTAHVSGRPGFSDSMLRLTSAQGNVTVGDMPVVPFAAAGTAVPATSTGTAIVQGDFKLLPTAMATFDIPFVDTTANTTGIRAAEIPNAVLPAGFKSLDVVYALAPFGTVASAAIPFEIANLAAAKGWTDTTTLDVYELMDDPVDPNCGNMSKVGAATVAAGVVKGNITRLSWLGLKKTN